MKSLKQIGTDIKHYSEQLTHDGFKQVFDHIDQLNIKKGVDKLGLDKFINQCAIMAAGSGAISGSGGVLTMVIGMPVDVLNLITQQFRVTMAIMYHNRGSYQMGFDEFMKLVAISFKVETGIALSKTMMESIAEKIILNLGVRTAERLVPVVGAVIGGTTNYMFIKRMAKSVKEMQAQPMVIQIS